MTGQQLKLKILEIGKTQKFIADALGVSGQSLSSVLSAKDVRSGTIERIAQALNVPVSLIYGEQEHGSVAVSGDVNGDNFQFAHDIKVEGIGINKLIDTVNSQQDTISEQNKLISRLVTPLLEKK